jgi:hypothetical protein
MSEEEKKLIQLAKDIVNDAEIREDHRHKGMIWVMMRGHRYERLKELSYVKN